jgi:LysM repeat protein
VSPYVWVQRMMALSAICGLLLVAGNARHHLAHEAGGSEKERLDPHVAHAQASIAASVLQQVDDKSLLRTLGGARASSSGSGDNQFAVAGTEKPNNSSHEGTVQPQADAVGTAVGTTVKSFVPSGPYRHEREGINNDAMDFGPPNMQGPTEKFYRGSNLSLTSPEDNAALSPAHGAQAAQAPVTRTEAVDMEDTSVATLQEDWVGTWYTVVSGDTLSVIAIKHHVPMQGILAINNHSIQSADTINVGQMLRIPTEKDARRLAGLPPTSPPSPPSHNPSAAAFPTSGGTTCNYALNPSFEEAADAFGLPLAAVDSEQGRAAFAW